MDQSRSPATKALFQQLIDNVDVEADAQIEELFYKTIDRIAEFISDTRCFLGRLWDGHEDIESYESVCEISKVILEAVKTNLDVVKHFRYEIINFQFTHTFCGFASLVHLYCAIKGDPSSLKCYRIENRNYTCYLVNSEYTYVDNTLKKYKYETVYNSDDYNQLVQLAKDLYAKV